MTSRISQICPGRPFRSKMAQIRGFSQYDALDFAYSACDLFFWNGNFRGLFFFGEIYSRDFWVYFSSKVLSRYFFYNDFTIGYFFKKPVYFFIRNRFITGCFFRQKKHGNSDFIKSWVFFKKTQSIFQNSGVFFK